MADGTGSVCWLDVGFSPFRPVWRPHSSDSHIPYDTTVGDLGKFDVRAIVGIMDSAPETYLP